MQPDNSPSPTAFLHQLALAIDAEHAAELAEVDNLLTRCTPKQLQDAGLALINLKIAATRTGLGGKCLVDLDPAVPGVLSLPPHKLRNGDIVAIETHDSGSFAPSAAARTTTKGDGKSGNGTAGVSGVVFRVTDAKLTLVCDEDPTDDLNGGSKVRVVKLVNEISHKRLSGVIKTLQSLVADGKAFPTRLMDVLLNGAIPQFDGSVSRAKSATGQSAAKKGGKSGPSIKWFNPDLNQSQQAAVELALAAQDVALIHGPPGTGKTHTLIEIIRHLVAQNLRILVCGPSNISVDNIVERLAPLRLPMLRIGHPARLLPSVLAHSLDVRVQTCDEGQLVADIVREMDQLHGNARKAKSRSERRGIYDEIKVLRKELKQREAAVVRNLIRGAKVVLTTLNGAGGKKLDKEEFDVVVIDECAQALEPECWLALLKSRRAILAGDHLQLPPTIKSDSPTSAKTLSTTLFERLINRPDGPQLSRLLNVQYRMHTDIMTYPSAHLYKAQLVAHDSVARHTLLDVANVHDTDDTRHVLLLVDTAGADMWESVPETGDTKSVVLAESKCNEAEADLAATHVKSLVQDGGVSPKEIVVLTPYNAQVALIKSKLRQFDGAWPADVEVGSVDGMQGREKDAVVLSLVRSNDAREVGFLAEERRLNVAVTRARRHLCVVCDSETVSASAFCKGLVEYMTEHGELRYPGY